jgi:hypothetical protein
MLCWLDRPGSAKSRPSVKRTTLRLTILDEGKRINKEIPLAVEGDQMFSREGAKSALFGWYDGPLPPHCPQQDGSGQRMTLP